MHPSIKQLLLALGFGLAALTVQATCRPCADSPEGCPTDQPVGPSDSMPEGVIVDSMPADVFVGE